MSESAKHKNFFLLSEASALCGGSFYPQEAAENILSQNFKVDSREIETDDVFVALKGERTDGHKYVESAVERGASCVMINKECFTEKKEYIERTGVLAIIVEDAEKALVELAAQWLEAVSPKVVGITGSVGKTTTREFLYSILKEERRVHSAIRSYNTLIGCGMTVLGMPKDTDILILEFGTNKPGEIGEMVEKFPATHAIITEVTPAHLEGLKSLEGVLAAKLEITRSSKLEYLSYNSDNSALSAAVKLFAADSNECKNIKTIGVGSFDTDLLVSNVNQTLTKNGEPRLSFLLLDCSGSTECRADIFGSQHARNIAFAYSAAKVLGVENDIFVSHLAGLELPPGRGRIYSSGYGGLIVDESYNANPSSVSRALKNVIELELQEDFQRVAVLGGMRELGDESGSWHEVIMSRASLFDRVYLIGPEWDSVKTLQGSLKGRYPNAEAFMDDIDAKEFKRSIVLVKGSRFYELEKLLPFLAGGDPR